MWKSSAAQLLESVVLSTHYCPDHKFGLKKERKHRSDDSHPYPKGTYFYARRWLLKNHELCSIRHLTNSNLEIHYKRSICVHLPCFYTVTGSTTSTRNGKNAPKSIFPLTHSVNKIKRAIAYLAKQILSHLKQFNKRLPSFQLSLWNILRTSAPISISENIEMMSKSSSGIK